MALSVTQIAHKLTWGLSLDLRGERPATKGLHHNTTPSLRHVTRIESGDSNPWTLRKVQYDLHHAATAIGYAGVSQSVEADSELRRP